MKKFKAHRYNIEVLDTMEVTYFSFENQDENNPIEIIKRGEIYENAKVFNAPDDLIDIHLANGDIILGVNDSYFKFKTIKL